MTPNRTLLFTHAVRLLCTEPQAQFGLAGKLADWCRDRNIDVLDVDWLRLHVQTTIGARFTRATCDADSDLLFSLTSLLWDVKFAMENA